MREAGEFNPTVQIETERHRWKWLTKPGIWKWCSGFGQDEETRALHLALASGVWALTIGAAALSHSREPNADARSG